MNPIPFSERQPEPSDCNSKGECWYFHNMPLGNGFWSTVDNGNGLWDEERRKLFRVTHWLPYDALPNPNGNGDYDPLFPI